MKEKDVLKWNTRASALYAFGVWTFIGSLAYLKYTGRLDDPSAEKKTPKPEDDEENPYRRVYETAHTKTVYVYNKDFTPSWLHRFIWFFTGGPRRGGSEK